VAGDARYAAVDVQYLDDGGAQAALVVSEDPAFTTLTEERTVLVEQVAEYRPGRFYERELPALQQVLSGVAPVDLVREMAGDARLPDALRRVDRLARGATPDNLPPG